VGINKRKKERKRGRRQRKKAMRGDDEKDNISANAARNTTAAVARPTNAENI
jgi:hypothetical protein